MSLRYGDLLYMEHREFGTTLYMVINPPIVCEYCKSLIKDWELDEDKIFICPFCYNQIKKFDRPRCSTCGREDMISLIIATNNNFHVSNDGVVPYQHKLNMVFICCGKQTEKEIADGKLRKLGKEEALWRKRQLVWTSLDEYDPSKSMPDWIKEKVT